MSGDSEQLQQIPLADAAKEADVKRFLPSAWLPVIPPGGVHIFRDMKEQVEADIAEALPILQTGGMDLQSVEGAIVAFKAVARQYVRSWGLRGDNTPQKAKELGYVTSKELWPEMELVSYDEFLTDMIRGRASPVYDQDRREEYRQAWGILKEQKRPQQDE